MKPETHAAMKAAGQNVTAEDVAQHLRTFIPPNASEAEALVAMHQCQAMCLKLIAQLENPDPCNPLGREIIALRREGIPREPVDFINSLGIGDGQAEQFIKLLLSRLSIDEIKALYHD